MEYHPPDVYQMWTLTRLSTSVRASSSPHLPKPAQTTILHMSLGREKRMLDLPPTRPPSARIYPCWDDEALALKWTMPSAFAYVASPNRL